MSLFPYVVDCMCGNNNQSLKQAFFKPCFSKCAQFTERYPKKLKILKNALDLNQNGDNLILFK